MAIFNQLMNNFSALRLREQAIAVVVGSVVLALGGNILLLKPLQIQINQARALDKQHKAEIASAIADLSTVDGKLARGVDPLEKELATRDDFLQKIAKADAFFMQHDATGVQVASLVRSLLDESPGLSLVSLKTLPSQVFYAPPAPPPPPKATEKAINTAVEGIAKVLPFGLPEAATASAQAPPPPAALQKTIYRHGVEITVKGKYPQLVAYMEKLQKFPKRVFWSEVQLTVSPYPVNVLKVVIYTLSDQPVAPLL
jgi:MSHA biogenesis protein MshJ